MSACAGFCFYSGQQLSPAEYFDGSWTRGTFTTEQCGDGFRGSRTLTCFCYHDTSNFFRYPYYVKEINFELVQKGRCEGESKYIYHSMQLTECADSVEENSLFIWFGDSLLDRVGWCGSLGPQDCVSWDPNVVGRDGTAWTFRKKTPCTTPYCLEQNTTFHSNSGTKVVAVPEMDDGEELQLWSLGCPSGYGFSSSPQTMTCRNGEVSIVSNCFLTTTTTTTTTVTTPITFESNWESNNESSQSYVLPFVIAGSLAIFLIACAMYCYRRLVRGGQTTTMVRGPEASNQAVVEAVVVEGPEASNQVVVQAVVVGVDPMVVGAPATTGAKFCTKCGKAAPTATGVTNFCTHCGNRFGA